MEKKSILMIDDVKFNLASAREVLKDEYILYEAISAKEGFDILEDHIPDLILLDIIMPEMDGYEMITQLKKIRRYKGIPVIFLTAETKPESEVKGFDLGAVDFITKPFVPTVMKRRIATQIELSAYQHSLEKLVDEKVAEIEKMQDALSTGFAELVESRDGITGGHVKNTGIYFDAFINALKDEPRYKNEITENYVRKTIRSAPLHDIGKIGIDDVVLRKKGSLDGGEREYMEKHATMGASTFHKIRKKFPESEFLEIAEEMALYHHERWDGKGYPTGKKGTDIPLCARIMSIVDVYDALTSERPYKKPFSHEKSMALIVEGRGTQFDPELVDEFVKYSDLIKLCLEKKNKLRN
ncbi:MAG: response regulator [Clostridia bacterium]|nr:response regulator [Clostridia bacterium]